MRYRLALISFLIAAQRGRTTRRRARRRVVLTSEAFNFELGDGKIATIQDEALNLECK